MGGNWYQRVTNRGGSWGAVTAAPGYAQPGALKRDASEGEHKMLIRIGPQTEHHIPSIHAFPPILVGMQL